VKAGPPGWQPHQTTHRIDGWIVDPADENCIHSAVAEEMIARAMPLLGDDTVDIRARMWTRQRMHELENAVLGDGDDE
jgi:hypothetical protein